MTQRVEAGTPCAAWGIVLCDLDGVDIVGGGMVEMAARSCATSNTAPSLFDLLCLAPRRIPAARPTGQPP